MTKFRVADHKTIRAKEREFLFLAAEKTIFEMDPPTRDLLGRWSEAGDRTRKEVTAWLTDLPEAEREDLLDRLLARRAIVSTNGPAQQGPCAFTRERKIPLKTLILHVTEVCNLRCTYCYQAEAADREAGRGQQVMSREVAQRTVHFLFEHAGPLEELAIVFFGGEPLLNFGVIQFVVDLAKKKAKGSGKRVSFALTTNGTVLTDEIVRFLDKENIGITVSIDGYKAVHDRYRRFPDDRPSYETILPKVKGLFERYHSRPVAARVTVAEEAGGVGQILRHLIGLGFLEAGFAPVTTGHSDFQLDDAAMDQLLGEFKGLAKAFIETAREGKILGFSNLIDLLVSLHQGEVMNYPCGAGLGLFSVGPEGRLYLCQRFTGQDDFCMGDVFKGFDRERLAQFRREAEISNKAACKTCWARTICTGGCYHEACVREGSHLSPNLHYCGWIRKWGEVGLQAYCEIAAERPEFLDMLCMSRGYPPETNGQLEERGGGSNEEEQRAEGRQQAGEAAGGKGGVRDGGDRRSDRHADRVYYDL
jgi:uncharacterized protein